MVTKEVVIDAATHTEIIQSLSEKLKAYNVFPDIVEQMCTGLQKHLKDGDYADITEGKLKARWITPQRMRMGGFMTKKN
jgi:hypothetical protein